MSINIVEAIVTANKCYQIGTPLYPQGIMLHSIGCPQPNASSAKPFYGTDVACFCTGAIAVQQSDVIYVKGATLEGNWHERLGAFSGATGGCYFCKQFATLLGDKYYKIVLDPSYAYYGNIGYIMFSALGTGEGVVVTKNEEIL